MDILFINSTVELTLRKECNGTLLLATKLLEAGFDTNVLRFGQVESYGKEYKVFIGDMVEEILKRNARCVSFYCLWPNYHIMLRIARELKAVSPETLIVLGGPQCAGTAEETLKTMPFVDYISVGEGENIVVPLFSALLRGQGSVADVPGTYYREDGKILHNDTVIPLCDLDALPYWDDRLLLPQTDPELHKDYYFMPIDVGRGCPYSCTFCCTSYFWRRTYRLKSPQRIVDDIRYHYEKYGIRGFLFSHDAFTVNQKLVSEVCDRIIEEGLDITWRCAARVDCITEELILKMKQAGMNYIELGVESGSPRMQKVINKNLNLERAKRIVQFLLDQDIYVTLFFMYGFPGETEADINETMEMMMSLMDQGVARTAMSFCQFSPNSHLTETYMDQLVYDPEIRITYHGVYGYEDEEAVIRANKVLFPFYFNLDTPLRKEYQYLYFLNKLYRDFPNTRRYVRELYHGDNLQFFRDFYQYNRHWLDCEIHQAEKNIELYALEMMLNVTAHLEAPYMRQLEGLLRYSYCVYKVSRSKEDRVVREIYDFNVVNLKLKHPISAYAPGKTEILVQMKDGKFSTEIIKIYWEE